MDLSRRSNAYQAGRDINDQIVRRERWLSLQHHILDRECPVSLMCTRCNF
ncbi:hypothetical protein NP493_411g01007 [Ridgeia piscesae]|uniref:Uncharacterized protein n=1 Tax=Ridgeia piscesae TaxID=27915 RepID=A0AAD9NVF7_RIDPI|nr:hypothetical protein NP493_411g01007 [Ridgeia piscesae]